MNKLISPSENCLSINFLFEKRTEIFAAENIKFKRKLN